VDKSNVSRYLSGRTVPPWQFVHQFMAELKVSRREIEARRDADVQAHHAEIVVLHSGMNDLIEERVRLLNRVAELRAELELVQQMRVEAERDCESLEHELDSAEQRAALEKEELRAFASAQRERAEKLEKHASELEMSLYTETLVLAEAVETPRPACAQVLPAHDLESPSRLISRSPRGSAGRRRGR
jgi:SMC interacting uncharacterized protein involved in chromosome segregation